MHNSDHYAAWLSDGIEAVRRAGDLVRDAAQRPRQVTHKGYRDLVTETDIAAQALITDAIRAKYPHHAFIVEEEDPSLPADGPVHWVIDPIDGTSNFSRNIGLYAICLGIMVGDEVVAGCVYDPVRDELYQAVRGRGSSVNDRPLQVSQTAVLEEAIIACDFSRDPRLRQQGLDVAALLLPHVHTIRALGSAGLGLVWTAAGRLDAYYNFTLSAWDVAGPSLILSEAGGQLSTLDGDPLDVRLARNCRADNGRLGALLAPSIAAVRTSIAP